MEYVDFDNAYDNLFDSDDMNDGLDSIIFISRYLNKLIEGDEFYEKIKEYSFNETPTKEESKILSDLKILSEYSKKIDYYVSIVNNDKSNFIKTIDIENKKVLLNCLNEIELINDKLFSNTKYWCFYVCDIWKSA